MQYKSINKQFKSLFQILQLLYRLNVWTPALTYCLLCIHPWLGPMLLIRSGVRSRRAATSTYADKTILWFCLVLLSFFSAAFFFCLARLLSFLIQTFTSLLSHRPLHLACLCVPPDLASKEETKKRRNKNKQNKSYPTNRMSCRPMQVSCTVVGEHESFDWKWKLYSEDQTKHHRDIPPYDTAPAGHVLLFFQIQIKMLCASMAQRVTIAQPCLGLPRTLLPVSSAAPMCVCLWCYISRIFYCICRFVACWLLLLLTDVAPRITARLKIRRDMALCALRHRRRRKRTFFYHAGFTHCLGFYSVCLRQLLSLDKAYASLGVVGQLGRCVVLQEDSGNSGLDDPVVLTKGNIIDEDLLLFIWLILSQFNFNYRSLISNWQIEKTSNPRIYHSHPPYSTQTRPIIIDHL